jgi:hypothetical protein
MDNFVLIIAVSAQFLCFLTQQLSLTNYIHRGTTLIARWV